MKTMPITLTFFGLIDRNRVAFDREPRTVQIEAVSGAHCPYSHRKNLIRSKIEYPRARRKIASLPNYTYLPAQEVPALMITYENGAGMGGVLAPFCSIDMYDEALATAKETAKKNGDDVINVDISSLQRAKMLAFVSQVVPVLNAAARSNGGAVKQSFDSNKYWPYLG